MFICSKVGIIFYSVGLSSESKLINFFSWFKNDNTLIWGSHFGNFSQTL
jgi:hypothetical protein